MVRKKSRRRGRLEQALASLRREQAILDKTWPVYSAATSASGRQWAQWRRINDECFARIEALLLEKSRLLAEQGRLLAEITRLLQGLPDVVSETTATAAKLR